MLKKRVAKGAIAACAAMALGGAYAAVPAFTGVTNYWVGADWADYGAAANWRVNDPDAGANAVPTANDMIYLNDATTYKFDLGGQPWTVGRIAQRADQFYSGSGAGSGLIEVTNGSLTVSTLVAFKMRLNVWDGGTFSLDAPNLFFHHGAVDACAHNVKRGGTLNLNKLAYQGYHLTVDAGATANLNTSTISIHPAPQATNNSYFDIYGTLNIPNGFTTSDGWSPSATSSTVFTRFTLFPDGVMTVGGKVTKKTRLTGLHFLLKGGVLRATGMAEFENVTSFAVEDNVAMEFNVAAGATLSASNATYGAGSVITKTGDGNLVLGKNPVASLVQQAGIVTISRISVLPASFTMNAGTLRVEKPNVALEGLSFPSGGYTLDIRAPGLRVDSPVSYDNLAITIDEELCAGGVYALQSDDAAFLSYAKGVIESSSPDLIVSTVGDGLKVVRMTDNTFDATKSSDLSDVAAWKGARVPVGEDVIITGTGTVQYTASAPAFRTIAVQDGATLSVSGGTLAEPVDLPPVSLVYDVRLLVEGGAFAQSTNGIDCVATAELLPVLEIATNATLTLQTPGLPKANTAIAEGSYTDYGFRLYNVNLKWYGQIRMPKERTSSSGVMSQGLIGWAAAGDTTYIGLDCQGGTLYRNDTVNNISGNFTPLMIVYPNVGGTVIPVGTLLLRDFHREGEGEYVGNGTQIGVNSPASVRIPVVFDGRTEVKCDGLNRIDGGTDLTIRGPARWHYEHDFYNDQGWSRQMQICGAAKLTLEDGGYMALTPSYGETPHGFHNLGTEEGSISLCMKDSYIGFWEWLGSGATSARIEDSYIMVGQLYRYQQVIPGNNSLISQTSLFNNFHHIEVPEGKTMWVVATNIWRGSGWSNNGYAFVHDWDRVSTFGPPITGGGNVSVTNALKGTQAKYSMTAIITNSANTATGRAWAEAPSPVGARSYLLFGDGANWAGTVVANGRVGLTNLTAEVAAPVSVTFGTLLFETNFPVRLWKSAGVTTNDVINITGGVSGGYGLEPEFMDGYEPEVGDTFNLGAYPANVALPKLAAGHKWRLYTEEQEGVTYLMLRYQPRGFTLTVK